MGLAYGKISLPAESNQSSETSSRQEIQEGHSCARPLSDERRRTCTGPCSVVASGGGASASKSSCSDGDDADEIVGARSEAELLLSDGVEEAARPARERKRASKMPRRPDEKRPRVTAPGNVSDDHLEPQTLLQPSHSAYFDALDDVLDEEAAVLGLERGECSAQMLLQDGAGELFHCSICMERKPLAESFDVRPCLHIYCTGCTSRYVASKVEQNATSIRCPAPGCRDGILEAEACRPLLEEAVYQRWVASLCEAAVGTDGIYCPYRDCSALLIDDGGPGGGVRRAECPHCRRTFCARCKVPWHEGIGCGAFQALPEGERAREDLMLKELAAGSRWQRCPQCKIFVERTEGCVFITCRCGHCFCYGCASPMSGETHFCKNCRRTW